MIKVFHIILAVLVIAAGPSIYWHNLSECMTEFSTFYCITQVK